MVWLVEVDLVVILMGMNQVVFLLVTGLAVAEEETVLPLQTIVHVVVIHFMMDVLGHTITIHVLVLIILVTVLECMEHTAKEPQTVLVLMIQLTVQTMDVLGLILLH